MEVLEGIAGLKQVPAGRVLSIGNFDGLHLGHERILRTGRELKTCGRATGLTVVTFEPHPLTVLRPALAPPRLTPPATKQLLLRGAGVDELVILPPTSDVLNLAAEDFWKILRDDVRPTAIIEGDSFTFGKGRGGSAKKLREWAVGTGIDVQVAEPVEAVLSNLQIVRVNSSLIRWLLSHGRARDAAKCLGRPYGLEGRVVPGFQRGKTIGTPTANLDCGDQMIPADGIYAARADVEGVSYPVALSIGTLPTFGEHERQVEGFLVGFGGDLYGQALKVEVLDWVREQQKYPSVEALKEQIARDVEEVLEIVGAGIRGVAFSSAPGVG
jgi:riboflavin kinase/FMN adenylyltransferase